MSRNTKIKLILNPVAGKGHSAVHYAQIEAFLQELPAQFDLAKTTGSGHAYHLAKEAARSGEYALVVAMGGDGTVNEVVNGLMTVKADLRPTLGILPAGRGSDFCKAKGIKLPHDLHEAARTLVGQHEVEIDLGLVTYETGIYQHFEENVETVSRYFINVASLGFDAVVTEEANRPPVTWWQKKASYYSSIFVALRTYRNRQLVYKLDDQTYKGLFNSIIAANGNYYGSGMKIAPLADPRDGQLEVVLLGDINTRLIMAMAPLLYLGWHRIHPKVKRLAGQRLTIETVEPHRLPLQIDGEVVGQAPVSFEIVPKALRLKVP